MTAQSEVHPSTFEFLQALEACETETLDDQTFDRLVDLLTRTAIGDGTLERPFREIHSAIRYLADTHKQTALYAQWLNMIDSLGQRLQEKCGDSDRQRTIASFLGGAPVKVPNSRNEAPPTNSFKPWSRPN